MSLLKDLNETITSAAVGAGDIAGYRNRLFTGEKVDKPKKKKKKKTTMFSRLKEAMDYSPEDVVSKLKAAEKKSDLTKDTIVFGLEDDDGKTVKVYVQNDQAEDFENALSDALDNADDKAEIAELLFDLKDKFDILDVIWPEIPEDEEAEGEMGDIEAEGEGELGAEGEGEMGGEEMAADQPAEDETKTALSAVMDMLKGEAEARKAEAEAKKAEAEAEASKYAAQAAETKVKREEEVLDMEEHNRKKSEAEKEAKKLASLAKFRYEKGKELEDLAHEEEPATVTKKTEVEVAAPEEEEVSSDHENHPDELDLSSPEDYMKYVRYHLRSQN